ncbi:MAG TPA: thiol reductant ABC exporter subunit CydD [Actinomycetota bacterium]
MRRSVSTDAVERRLWKDHPRARRTVAAAVGLSAAAAVCWIVFALLLSVAISRVFVDGGTLASVDALLLAMLALAVVRGALLWSSDVVGQRAAGGIETDLRERLAAALVALGPTVVRGERIGDLVYTAGEGVDALDPYVTRYVPARVLAVLVPVLVAIVVAVLDPWSVLILLIAGPMLMLLLGLIGRRVRDLAERRERELAWMNAHFLDVLRGLPTLKMFGRSAEQAETIRAVSRRQGSSTMDVLRTAFQTTLVLEWGATAATALVAIETSVRLMAGGLTFERALAVLLLTPEFFLPLRRLSAEYHVGRSAAAAAERVYAVLDTPARIHVPAPGAARPLPARLDVRFDDVVVTYDDGSRTALAGCSLQIPQGRTVALVGPTGAGKTTVANVLLRFVDPEHGRVTVGGVALSELDPAHWRTRVAWVPQQASLFHGTVADNLRLARPDASDDDLVAAATAANAHGFVTDLPDGYATPVGEGGARLSGGERQRLALARAFLKDAPFVILDEPTSHLDRESETLVLEAASRLMRARTVLVIAHRPEPVAGADMVVTLRAGRVVRDEPPDAPNGRVAPIVSGGRA